MTTRRDLLVLLSRAHMVAFAVVVAAASAWALAFLSVAKRRGMPARMLAAAALVHLGAAAAGLRIVGVFDAAAAPLVDPWILTAAIVGTAALVNGEMLVHRAPTTTLGALRWFVVASAWLGAFGLLDILWRGLLSRIPHDVAVFAIAGGSVVLFVAGVVGAIAVALAGRWVSARRAVRPVTIASTASIRVGCPRCGTPSVRPIGLSRCDACDEPLEILIDEPRCACGYLLGRDFGRNCPECGRPVPRFED